LDRLPQWHRPIGQKSKRKEKKNPPWPWSIYFTKYNWLIKLMSSWNL
jgi:hypothetical protein